MPVSLNIFRITSICFKFFVPISHGNCAGYLCETQFAPLYSLWPILVKLSFNGTKKFVFVCNKRANESKTIRLLVSLVCPVPYSWCVRCTLHIIWWTIFFLSFHKHIILLADISKCFMNFMNWCLMGSVLRSILLLFVRCCTSKHPINMNMIFTMAIAKQFIVGNCLTKWLRIANWHY